MIGLAENLSKQAGIAGITIGHQDEVMTVRQAAGPLAEQAPDHPLIALALDMGEDKLALRVYQLGFPVLPYNSV
jgi:hypothetical protein